MSNPIGQPVIQVSSRSSAAIQSRVLDRKRRRRSPPCRRTLPLRPPQRLRVGGRSPKGPALHEICEVMECGGKREPGRDTAFGLAGAFYRAEGSGTGTESYAKGNKK